MSTKWLDGSMARWLDGSMARWLDGSMARWRGGSVARDSERRGSLESNAPRGDPAPAPALACLAPLRPRRRLLRSLSAGPLPVHHTTQHHTRPHPRRSLILNMTTRCSG
jgi:hypothetical protein